MNRYYMQNFRCAPITSYPFIQHGSLGIHDPIRINRRRRQRVVDELFPPRNLYFVRAIPGTAVDLAIASEIREARQWVLFKVDTIQGRLGEECLRGSRFEEPGNLPQRGDWVLASINTAAIEGLVPINPFERRPLSFVGEVRDAFIPQPAQLNAINALLNNRNLRPQLRNLGLNAVRDIQYLIHWTHDREIRVRHGRRVNEVIQSCGYVNLNGQVFS